MATDNPQPITVEPNVKRPEFHMSDNPPMHMGLWIVVSLCFLVATVDAGFFLKSPAPKSAGVDTAQGQHQSESASTNQTNPLIESPTRQVGTIDPTRSKEKDSHDAESKRLAQEKRTENERFAAAKARAEEEARIAERNRIEAERRAEQAREAEKSRLAREQMVKDLIAKSEGRLAELAPLVNGTTFRVDAANAVRFVREHVETACNATVVNETTVTTPELLALGADVKVVTVEVMTASVEKPPASFGNGTQLIRVDATLLVSVKSAKSKERLLSKEMPGSKTYFASEVKGLTDTALVERLVNSQIRELEKDAAFQSVF